jgi:putative ABC transport system permease protein
MMVAVDLANSSASQAFSLSTESIAGRATHQITAAPDDIPSRLYRDLRVQLGLRNIAPVVSGPILLAQAGNLPLRLLGVDPFAEAPFRNYLSAGQDNASLETLTTLLVEPDTILLSQGLGQRLGLAAGDRLTVIVEGRTHTVRLVGLLRTGDDLSRRAIDTLALADISTAQEILGKEGALSHIYSPS